MKVKAILDNSEVDVEVMHISGRRIHCPLCSSDLGWSALKCGVLYVYGSREKPLKAFNSDLCRCSSCNGLILTDFGSRQILRSDYSSDVRKGTRFKREDLKKFLADEESEGKMVVYEKAVGSKLD